LIVTCAPRLHSGPEVTRGSTTARSANPSQACEQDTAAEN
jgi:hypothetical protein